jgi:type I restriction enzyme S subunit
MGIKGVSRERKAAAVHAGPVEGPWDLPDGWRWERLGAVSTEPMRGHPSVRFSETFRYLDVSSIEGAQIHPKCIKSQDAPSRARQFVQTGDTVLSGVRVYLRNIAVVPADQVDVASTAFCVLRPGPGLDARFMHRWISSDWFINALLPLQRGNSPPAVLDADVRDQPIPVPPLDTQRAISTRIDNLFVEIGEGEAALAEARAGVETYRKALLKAAVTGELTAEWRRDNPPQETGEQLLQSILADRRARWHADPKNARKKYTEPAGPNTDGLPELPEGWTWASLDQLAWSAQYGTSQKCDYAGKGEAVLRIPNLKKGAIERTDLKRGLVALGLKADDYVAPGDILIVRTNGSEALIGRAGMAVEELDEPTFFASYLIRYRLTGDHNRWLWIRAFTESSVFRDCVLASIGSSAGQYNLSMGKLDAFPIALPPVAEIHAALSAYSQGYDQVPDPQLVEGVSAQASTLRQSILAAAFRGELGA